MIYVTITLKISMTEWTRPLKRMRGIAVATPRSPKKPYIIDGRIQLPIDPSVSATSHGAARFSAFHRRFKVGPRVLKVMHQIPMARMSV
jgi:hypothetical protein